MTDSVSIVRTVEEAAKNRGLGFVRDAATGHFAAGNRGRIPGSKNRRTAERVAQLKVDPFDYLAGLLADEKTEK
jgi:hypothetical protein